MLARKCHSLVQIVFFVADSAYAGPEYAARNAVIPADLIEEVAEAGGSAFESWLTEAQRNYERKRLEAAGITDPREQEQVLPSGSPQRTGDQFVLTNTASETFGTSTYFWSVENHISNSHVDVTVQRNGRTWLHSTRVPRTGFENGVLIYSGSGVTFRWNVQTSACTVAYSSSFSAVSAQGICQGRNLGTD